MRRGLIFGVLMIVVAIAAIVALCLRPVPVTGTSGKALAYSVRGALDGSTTGECRGSGDEWRCTALAGSDSGSGPDAIYDVTVDNLGCWDGTRSKGDASLAETISGCITIADLVRLDD